MVNWNLDKMFILTDGIRCSILIGQQFENKIEGKYIGEVMNQRTRNLQFKQNLATSEMKLVTGIQEGKFRESNKRVVLINHFLDGSVMKNNLSPAYIENEQLQNENLTLKRMVNYFRERLFSLTGKDLFEEAMLRTAKKSSEIRSQFYRDDSSGGGGFGSRFGGGFGGYGGGSYSSYYPRTSSPEPQTPSTEL